MYLTTTSSCRIRVRREILINLTSRPGHGQANPNNVASIAYNKDVSANTVKWAIMDWLRDVHREGIWRVKPLDRYSADFC